MINEPTIHCECDNCQGSVEIWPEYKYLDYSGNNGFYDCSDDAVIKQLESEGWEHRDGSLICDNCLAT